MPCCRLSLLRYYATLIAAIISPYAMPDTPLRFDDSRYAYAAAADADDARRQPLSPATGSEAYATLAAITPYVMLRAIDTRDILL